MATCNIQGKILIGSEEAVVGAVVHAVPYDSPAIIQNTDTVISPEPVTTMTTSTGEFELDLIRNVKFTITIPEVGFRKTIVVPNEAGPIELWGLTDIFVSGDPTPTDNNEDGW